MSDALATYLADHLAGSVHVIELLKKLSVVYQNDDLGRFANEMLTEVQADRNVLENLAHQIGGGPSPAKEAAAWMGEKLSRVKVRHEGPASLGTFEAIEQLSLGILGKLALWRVLAVAAKTESRLQGIDYDSLTRRAEEQHNNAEERRMTLAPLVLTGQGSARTIK